MPDQPELPVLQLPDQAAWRGWLADNHEAAAGAWLKFAKKGAPERTVTYAEAVEEALCFGWIDGQARGLDEHFYLQRFTPRRRRSAWSQINRDKATRLIADGRMAPAGLAQVEAAQADGRWDNAYQSPSAATVPDDLQRALDANPRAKEFFATLTGSARYAFLYRLHRVRKPENRAKRIADYIELLSQGKTLNP
jgi:uncharacterized protein YdeI (YjbR/CyaY-like superfamily)